MLNTLLYRHILKIHKTIKSNCFLTTPPDYYSASPQVPLWWFPCCFTVLFFNNCIPKSRKMLFKLLNRHILKIHKTIKSNCFLTTPPDYCSTSPQVPLWWFSCCFTVSFFNNCIPKSRKMLNTLLYRHILKIHKTIKSNCFLTTPPDYYSASPQVPLWWFPCCFTVLFFNNCIPKSRKMLFKLLNRHILKIHKTIKSNCFLTTPPDYCSTSPQVPLWWFSCCFTVSFFNNCIPKSRKMLNTLLYRHILKIHKTIKSNCFLTTPPDYYSASPQVPLWWFPCCFTVLFFNNCIPKSRKMLFKLLNRHILKIHKTIKSNCFLTTPPDYCSASPQVPLWWFPCCFTVLFFNNCIPNSRKMLNTLLYRHILKIHKTIKSNCFLTTPPDYCSASPQVPLWWFSCCFTVSFFNNCIPMSRKMIFKLLNRHILKIHKTIKSNCFLTTPPDYYSASPQVPLWWFPCCFTVLFFNNCIPKSRKMLFKLLNRHILKIHKTIKSNCFLTTPPDYCSTSPQVPLWWFSCCFTVSFFNNCIPKSRKMLNTLLYRHI